MNFSGIKAAIEAEGLAVRGVATLSEAERTGPLADRRQLVLIGVTGQVGWDAFARSSEAADGLADPLDRWSRRCIDVLARRCDGIALYPFGGAPHWPFQRWAQRAEPLHPSPLGLLIHPVHGLWHSYRGAIAMADDLGAPPPDTAPSPCDACAERPCLSACPVGAFTPDGYDVEACAQWLAAGAEPQCMRRGCAARQACPVGRDYAHTPEQTAFGMRAFYAARAKPKG